MTDLELLIRDKYDGDESSVSDEDRDRLSSGEPLAYVIGWVPFLGVHVRLDTKPLIPRPETEWWAELVVNAIGTTDGRVLDLCAGSGAIGLSVLSHCPNAHVTFAEKNPTHLQDVERSITENNLDAERSSLIAGDLFENLQGQLFEVIVCNPPYIPKDRALETSVTDFEPTDALFSGNNGLDLIGRIAREVKKHLVPGGALYLEADIENIEEARDLLVAGGATSAVIKDDLYGRPRLVLAYY